MLSKFYRTWASTRAFIIAGMIAISLLMAITGNSWNVEMEYIGPGSEAEHLERETRDRENEKAWDRFNEGSRDERDARGAFEYERDHGV